MALIWKRRIKNFVKPVTDWILDGFKDEETNEYTTLKNSADTAQKSAETVLNSSVTFFQQLVTFFQQFKNHEIKKSRGVPAIWRLLKHRGHVAWYILFYILGLIQFSDWFPRFWQFGKTVPLIWEQIPSPDLGTRLALVMVLVILNLIFLMSYYIYRVSRFALYEYLDSKNTSLPNMYFKVLLRAFCFAAWLGYLPLILFNIFIPIFGVILVFLNVVSWINEVAKKGLLPWPDVPVPIDTTE